MKKDFLPLKQCILFNNFDDNSLENILKKCNSHIESFSKGESIAIEGDSIKSLGIILEGSIEVQKLFPSGRFLTMSKLSSGDIFGEVIIFSKRTTYPATLTSVTKSKVLFIEKNDILHLCSEEDIFLKAFMGLLSNKILMLNKKVTLLSHQSIREKIANLLISLYSEQNSSTITLNQSKKEIAESFGIPRPSLSREFIKMKDEGILDFDKNKVTIIDIELLENILM